MALVKFHRPCSLSIRASVGSLEFQRRESVLVGGCYQDMISRLLYLISDWNIIKRVFSPQDGEFWTAALPPSSGSSSPQQQKPAMGFSNTNSGSPRSGGKGGRVTLEDARNAFRRGGFSVVINRLQRRWRRIFRVSNILERVLGHPVNANLYMTPGGNQGFEAHFDWMDGACGYATQVMACV